MPTRPRRRPTLPLLAATVPLACALPLSAQTVAWTNTAGGNFNTSINWNSGLGPVPGALNTALFNLPNTYTLTVNTSPTNTALEFQNGTVTFRPDTAATRTYAFTSDINVSGGSLTLGPPTSGSNTLTLSTAATMAVNNAQLNVNVSNDVVVGSSFSLATNVGASATVTADGAGSTFTVNGAGLHNFGQNGSTATFNLQNSAAASFAGTIGLANSTVANSKGLLTVQSGADLSAANVTIGTGSIAGQIGSLTVTGAGSSVTQAGASTLVVGAAANSTGTLTVSSSATYSSGTGPITVNATGRIEAASGGTFTANGNITLNGGTLLRSSGGTFILAAGKNISANSNAQVTFVGGFGLGGGSTITLESGSDLLTTSFLDVAASGTSATLLVDGAGSSVTTSSTTSFWGQAGAAASVTFRNGSTGSLGGINLANDPAAGTAATLNVQSGATVSTSTLNVGTFGGSSAASINVTGAGSSLRPSFSLTVGHSSLGTGTVNIDALGALAFTAPATTTINTTGALTVTSGTFTTSGPVNVSGLFVANASSDGLIDINNTLTINNGGVVRVLNGPLHANSITVAGGGTLDLDFFTSEVVVDGGALTYPTGTVSLQDNDSDGTPTWRLTNGATFNPSGTLLIATTAHGTLRVESGSVVTATAGSTSVGGDSTFGSLRIDGAGSKFDATGRPVSFNSPTVPLAISNGGVLLAQGLMFVGGGSTNSTPNSVTGAGSRLELTGTLHVGTNGTTPQRLDVTAGASVQAFSSSIGGVLGSNGFMLVDGPSTSFTLTDQLSVAGSGTATLLISGGAAVAAGSIKSPSSGSGHGTTTITGAGSSLTSTGSVTLGSNFTGMFGTINVQAGANFTAGSLDIRNNGSLNISGGTVTVGSLVTSGTGLVNFNFGTVNVGFDLTIDGHSLAMAGESGADVDFGRNLNVAGAATLLTPTRVTGGSFTAGSLINPSLLQFSSGTFGLTASTLTVGPGGILGSNVVIDPSKTLVATGGLAVSSASLLHIDGGIVSASTVNNAGEILLSGGSALLAGTATLTNAPGAVLRGDGRITAPLSNAAGAEVRAESGKRLKFEGTNSPNSGKLNLQGGTLHFTQPLTNAPAGTITGRGFLHTASLTNQGQIQLSAGLTDVHGPLTNTSGSKVILSGNATATFYNPVTNNAGSEFRISTGSTAVFFAPVTGAGLFTGPGTKHFESGASAPSFLATNGHTIVESPASLTTSYLSESSLTSYGPTSLLPNSPQSTLATLDLSTTGTLDLANNTLLITSTPTSLIRQYLASSQLFSSTPDPNDTRSLGYLQTPSGTLIKLTLTGDANLDGQLNSDDFALIDRGALTSGSLWQQGDFNYDGTITNQDYLLLDRTFGQAQGFSPGFLAQRQSQFGPDYVSTLLTSIPEPGVALSSILYPLSSLLLKRRRPRTPHGFALI